MVQTFDPKKTLVTVAGLPISGYADGEAITVEREGDAFTKTTGADGYTARVKSNNRSGSITLTLLQTSHSNTILSALALADEKTNAGVVPVSVKDLSGTSASYSGTAWIKKVPKQSYGKDISNREWVLDCADLEVMTGGNFSSTDIQENIAAVMAGLGAVV